jgi:hypothetical protein
MSITLPSFTQVHTSLLSSEQGAVGQNIIPADPSVES